MVDFSAPAPAASTEGAWWTSKRFWIIVSIISVYIVWGSTYLAVRIALDSYPPFLMSGVRVLLAGFIVIGVLMLRGERLPDRKKIRNAMLIGVLMLGVGTGSTAFAEQWVDSGLAAIAVGAVPLWAGLFATFWEKRPTRREWGGIAIGLFGIVLLNFESGFRASVPGAIALIVGPMVWAFGSMWSRHLNLPHGLMATGFQMLGGGISTTVVGIISGEKLTGPVTLEATLAVIYLITFGSILAYSAYTYLLKNTRYAVATSYAYVNPMVAVVLGAIVLAEPITPLRVAAMFTILGGVALLVIARTRKAPQAAPS